VQQVLTTGKSARQGWTEKPNPHPQTINIKECLSIGSASFERFSNPFHIRIIKKGGNVHNYSAG
jgi:hypothetical protein